MNGRALVAVSLALCASGCSVRLVDARADRLASHVRKVGQDASCQVIWGSASVQLSDDTTLRFVLPEVEAGWPVGVAAIELRDARGDVRWRVDGSAVPGDCLTAHEAEGRIVVVSWSRVATGASVTAVDRRTGEVLWQNAAQALGAVVHSRYAAQVWSLVAEQAVILHGREGAGAYVEIFGLDGRRLRHQIL